MPFEGFGIVESYVPATKTRRKLLPVDGSICRERGNCVLILSNTVAGLLTRKDGIEIIQCTEAHRIAGLNGGATDMGHEKSVFQCQITRIDFRLTVKDIETRCRQFS